MAAQESDSKRQQPYELRHRPPVGTAPGTLIARSGAKASVIDAIVYDDDRLETHEDIDVDTLVALRQRWPMLWVNVHGLGDTETIQALGQTFNLHHLALEDALNVHQRPKVEPYTEHAFVIGRMPAFRDNALELEQLSLFLLADLVITIQEHPGDCFEPVRDRLRKSAGNRGRFLHADYLAYALLDAVVDSYFPILEHYSDEFDGIEQTLLDTPANAAGVSAPLHRIRRELHHLRRAAWPHRELFRSLMEDRTFMREEMRPYLRDCEDHAVQIVDLTETYRERAATAVDLQVTNLSYRMNDIMKTLTIIATVFMSMTFIAGIYGMNFSPDASVWNMPELAWRYGYLFALLLMAITGLGFIAFFWRRGWLGSGR